jgi:hypothetical protein
MVFGVTSRDKRELNRKMQQRKVLAVSHLP